MARKRKPLLIDCGPHGKRVAAVVCGHMVRSEKPVGFVENTDDPFDLQAWCDRCEKKFVAEGDKTPAFVAFHDMKVVCVDCYAGYKERHSTEGRKKQAEDDSIDCEVHGPARMAFVCQHLVHGSKLGFFHSDNGPYPDAWCDACDDRMMKVGHWTVASQRYAKITLVCHRCYVNIRRRNRAGKPKK